MKTQAVTADQLERCECCGERAYSRGRCKAGYEAVRRMIRWGKHGIRVKVDERRNKVIMTDDLAVKLGYLAPLQTDKYSKVKPMFKYLGAR